MVTIALCVFHHHNGGVQSPPCGLGAAAGSCHPFQLGRSTSTWARLPRCSGPLFHHPQEEGEAVLFSKKSSPVYTGVPGSVRNLPKTWGSAPRC